MPIDPPRLSLSSDKSISSEVKPKGLTIKKSVFYLILVILFLIIGMSFVGLEKRRQQNNVVTPTVTVQPKVIDIETVDWIKEGSEEVLPIGAAGSGDSKGIYPSTIIKVDNEYKLWYTGVDDNDVRRIFMAVSSDSVVWEKIDNSIPAPSNSESTNGRISLGLAGSGDEEFTRNPSVLYLDGKYYMWYSGSRINGSDSIYQATSSDGLTWNKTNNSIAERTDTSSTEGRIPTGTLGKGDDFHVEYITVVKKDENNLVAFYTGENNNQTGPSQVSIYSATSKDKGTTWEKVNNNVGTSSTEGRIVVGEPGFADHDGIVLPSVIINEGVFYIWYTGFQSEPSKITVLQAKSTDGLTWTKLSQKTAETKDWLMDPEGTNSEQEIIINVAIFKHEDELFLLYSATPNLQAAPVVYLARAE